MAEKTAWGVVGTNELVANQPKRDNAVYERVCMENGHNFTEAFSTGTAFCSRCGQSLASVQG